MYIVCHYGEIGLKVKNRYFFEEKLVNNIRKSLGFGNFEFVKRISGRIIVKIRLLDEEKEREVVSKLQKVFGLSYFSFAYSCQQDIQTIEKASLKIAQKNAFRSFRVRVSRSNKKFPLTSPEIEAEVGGYILNKFQNSRLRQGFGRQAKIKVDLENPDITFYIEIIEGGYVFLYTQKIKGLGGLPVGVSGKAVCLLSGGIDSPVAAFYAMKRGIKLIFVHFYTDFSEENKNKIENIVRVLNQYQFGSKLYFIPFLNIQKKIFENRNTSLSCLLCKRFMLRISQIIAFQEGAQAIVSGDNIGQVADQTLNNIGIIQAISRIPIIRPVVCQDKLEIIKEAQKIGTYNISIFPENFYCQRFLPFHPNTKASSDEVEKEESRLGINELISEALKSTKEINF